MKKTRSGRFLVWKESGGTHRGVVLPDYWCAVLADREVCRKVKAKADACRGGTSGVFIALASRIRFLRSHSDDTGLAAELESRLGRVAASMKANDLRRAADEMRTGSVAKAGGGYLGRLRIYPDAGYLPLVVIMANTAQLAKAGLATQGESRDPTKAEIIRRMRNGYEWTKSGKEIEFGGISGSTIRAAFDELGLSLLAD